MSEHDDAGRGDESADGRESRGQRTRLALQNAALRLLEGDKSFSSLSLREVAREAGVVPTAFYRHFADMKELGLTLVDETMHTLRDALQAARAQSRENTLGDAVASLARQVQTQHLHFCFIARELYGGRSAMRQAIRHEIDLFVRELALDLSRHKETENWSAEDLQMMASMLINILIATAEQMLEAPTRRPQAENAVIETAEKQLRLIALAAPHWKSAGR
jgi:AcrR family transcriptional regulator